MHLGDLPFPQNPLLGRPNGTEKGEEVGRTGQAQGHQRVSGKVAGGPHTGSLWKLVGKQRAASGVIGLWMCGCPSALGGDARASSPASWAPERPCPAGAVQPSWNPPPVSVADSVFTAGGGGQGEEATLPSPALCSWELRPPGSWSRGPSREGPAQPKGLQGAQDGNNGQVVSVGGQGAASVRMDTLGRQADTPVRHSP